MGFSCGIVGLPNAGKSTLFNALTSTASAEAANYPFCTIEPNVGMVGVPDSRLQAIAECEGSAKTIPTTVRFVDIAGLVRDAHKGEGLGNKFLGHIRQVDAIVHVLRAFENDVTHVEGSVHPMRDYEIIQTELLLADIESLENRQERLIKKAKQGDKESQILLDTVHKALHHLGEGISLIDVHNWSDEQKSMLPQLQSLTLKPSLYVCNVAENEILTGNAWVEQMRHAVVDSQRVITVSAQIESEIALLSPEERQMFLNDLGLASSGLERIIQAGYGLLDLITFFTLGPQEAHAWSTRHNAKAPEAAGVIHTDFQKGFIAAETVSAHDYLLHKGFSGAREAGKLRLEGRSYCVQDGDILHFRFNV